MKELGVKVHSLIKWPDWYYYMGKLGYLSAEFTNIMLTYTKDPYWYQDNKEIWNRFYREKERLKGKFV